MIFILPKQGDELMDKTKDQTVSQDNGMYSIITMDGKAMRLRGKKTAKDYAVSCCLPECFTIRDENWKDVTAEVLQPEIHNGKIVVSDNDGNLFYLPFTMKLTRTEDAIDGFITASVQIGVTG